MQPAPTRPRCSTSSAPPRAPRTRCRSASPGRRRSTADDRRHDPDHRAAAWCSGLPDGYRAHLPRASCAPSPAPTRGVLLAQQTAANLHVAPATRSRSAAPACPRRTVPVDGVVDLPAGRLAVPDGRRAAGRPAHRAAGQRRPAARGAVAPAVRPAGRAPRPDLRDAPRSTSPRATRCPPTRPPPTPRSTGAARNLEAPLAGRGLVGDNLAAALDAARSDAALRPGAVPVPRPARRRARRRCSPPRSPAPAPTGAAASRPCCAPAARPHAQLAAAGRASRPRSSARRRRGVGLGVAARASAPRVRLAPASAPRPAAALGWAGGAALAGLVIAAATVVAAGLARPARATVVAAGAAVGRAARPARGGCGSASTSSLLAASALVFWRPAATATSWCSPRRACRRSRCRYWAFAGPALLWVGAGLLAWRLADLAAAAAGDGCWPAAAPARRAASRPPSPRRCAASGACSPAPSRCSRWPSRSPRRPRRSTRPTGQQAEVDARLTNGADVTVTESPGAASDPAAAATLAAVPGVRGGRAAAAPLRLRRRRPAGPLRRAARHDRRPRPLQDAYFQGGTATQLMRHAGRAARTRCWSAPRPCTDFQLRPGDTVQPAPAGRAHQAVRDGAVPLRRASSTSSRPRPRTASSSPTPTTSPQRTGSDAVGTFLVDTGGRDAAARRRPDPRPARAPRRGHRHRARPRPSSGRA